MFAGAASRSPSSDDPNCRRGRAWGVALRCLVVAATGLAFALGRARGARDAGMDTSVASDPRPPGEPGPAMLVECDGAPHAVLSLAVADDGRLRYLIDGLYGIPEWVDAADVRVRTTA